MATLKAIPKLDSFTTTFTNKGLHVADPMTVVPQIEIMTRLGASGS